MKCKLLSMIAVGLLGLASFAAKADTYVGSANVSAATASGCYWALTYSSGGGGAPQFYDLTCSGVKVVTQQKVGGACYFYNLAAAYRLEGSGCSTLIYSIDTPPASILVGAFGTPPVAYNGCSWRLTSSSGGGGAPQFYTLGCSGAASVISMMTTGTGSSATCYITTAVIAGYRTEGTNCGVKVYKN